jgi:hypothetical protein
MAKRKKINNHPKNTTQKTGRFSITIFGDVNVKNIFTSHIDKKKLLTFLAGCIEDLP